MTLKAFLFQVIPVLVASGVSGDLLLFSFRFTVTDFSSEHNSESAGDDVSAEERHDLGDNVTSVPEMIGADRKDFPVFDEDGECHSQENQSECLSAKDLDGFEDCLQHRRDIRGQSATLVTEEKIPTKGNILFPSFFT